MRPLTFASLEIKTLPCHPIIFSLTPVLTSSHTACSSLERCTTMRESMFLYSRAFVCGRGVYLEMLIFSGFCFFTHSRVVTKSASFSPGKPTIISVKRVRSSKRSLKLLITRSASSIEWNLFILFSTSLDADCTGK